MTNLRKIFVDNEYITNLNFILLISLPISLLTGSAVINFIVILFDILFLIEIIKKKEKQIFKEKHIFVLILIWFYLIINSFIGINYENSIIRSIGFIRFVILAIGINYYFNRYYDEFIKYIIKFWSVVFVVVTLDLYPGTLPGWVRG